MSSRSAFIVYRPPVFVHLLQSCLLWCDFVLPSTLVQPGRRVWAVVRVSHKVVSLVADSLHYNLCRGVLARRLEGFTCFLLALLVRVDGPERIKLGWF